LERLAPAVWFGFAELAALYRTNRGETRRDRAIKSRLTGGISLRQIEAEAAEYGLAPLISLKACRPAKL